MVDLAVARNSADNPALILEAVFRRIEVERMSGVDILNPVLTVEAVGFRLWQDHWLGVLISPWSMSLVRLPSQNGSWCSVAEGKRLVLHLPAGDFPFLSGSEAEIGEYLTCPMIAEMMQFPDQETARQTALAIIEGVLNSSLREMNANNSAARDTLSRRAFLTGRC